MCQLALDNVVRDIVIYIRFTFIGKMQCYKMWASEFMYIASNRPKTPTRIDEYVGSRVRLRRKLLGISQESLGDSVGVSFQQIQKYEKGTNRIGAGRLLDIAACLNMPVSFFFQGADASYVPPEETTRGHDAGGLRITREGIELAGLFAEIDDPSMRKKILSLVRVLAEHYNADKTWSGINIRNLNKHNSA